VGAADRLAELDELGVIPLFRGRPGFPVGLAELPDAPDVLFLWGTVPDRLGVAVVGTRRCSRYGRSLARAFGRAIAVAGWPLVSGLARGVDGEAHRGTTEAHGVGVAVLGSGPDISYPPEHRDLGLRLVELGGAILTEYPPGTAPEGWRFPPRNRIISGLAAAVVVVESAETGGALITAAAALEHGRSVFAVPGDVDRKSSAGCNRLIRDGAQPVLGPDDLVEELSLVLGPPSAPTATRTADPLLDALVGSARTLEELAVVLNEPVPDVLARVARLEAVGDVIMRNGTVLPAG
jgi:DNA processing protein